MRWPWSECSVCKSALEVMRGSLEEQKRQGERYDALVAELLAMKRDGFNVAPKPLPVPAVKASPSDEAITMRAGTDGRLRQHLTNWRNVARQNGAKDEELAERILRWDDPDGRDD